MRLKAVVLIGSLALFLVLSLSLIPQQSEAASYVARNIADISGDKQDKLSVNFLTDLDTVEAGSTMHVEALVTDQYDEPADEAWVVIVVRIPQEKDDIRLAQAGSDGLVETHITTEEDVLGVYTIEALADTSWSEASDMIQVEVVKPPPEEPPVLPYFQIGAFISAFISLALASTEAGGYSLFNIFAFPLYSRLKKEEVLDNFVRGQIYGLIVSNPGENYNSIREKLQVTNGTLSHHLRTLEIQGFIRSRKESIYRRFYPVPMKIPRDKGVKLSDLQISILGLLKKKPAPTQKEIVLALGISQQVASYNLRILSRKGFVEVRKEGRKRKYYEAEKKVSSGF